MREYKQQVRNIQKSSLDLILASDKIQTFISQFNLPPIPFQERVLQARKDLNLIYLTPTQRKIIDEMSREMAGMLPLHDK